MESASSSLKPRLSIQDPVDFADGQRGTPIVLAAFPDGRSFLDAYEHTGPAGELAVITRVQPRSGTNVILEILWPALPNRIYLRARVYRRRLGLLARLHPDAGPARDFLLQMARGNLPHYYKRRQRRYCVRAPIQWRRFGGDPPSQGVAEDLSTGGMLISTKSASPPVGEHVAVRVPANNGGQDLVLTGVVRHVRPRTGDSAFGVQFEYRSSGEQQRLRRLLRAFAARGVVLLTT
jgi:hypothetical protein